MKDKIRVEDLKRRGFTLVEVMIAMVIMSFLSVLVSVSIRSATKNKKKLSKHFAMETTLYDSLNLIKQDLQKAFNYQDVFYEIEFQALLKLNKSGQANPREVLQRQKLTHFIGESKELHFTTLNHFRTRYNARESNQMEVGYYLKDCKDKKSRTKSPCLWRRSSPMIDDKVDQDGGAVVLAKNVGHFKLSYRDNSENDEWLETWKSQRGREDHKNRFPTLVKVELKILKKNDPKAGFVEQSVVIPILFPNNKKLLQRPIAEQSQQRPGP